MGGDGGGHDSLVQAGVAAAAAQDEGEVAADFGEQVPAVEAATVVHPSSFRSISKTSVTISSASMLSASRLASS
ncbi:hypothetical protein [Streptomyces sp. NPDC058268]|uniref:hypothetical protein n=1 Tax=Streptomyces sp. NPDC058268 TaxID=3346413 RepID=UPI0036E580E7